MSRTQPPLLVALSDADRAQAIAKQLAEQGLEAAVAPAGDAALDLLVKEPFCVVIVDWNDAQASASARTLIGRFPDVQVIALATPDTALVVEAMRAGVCDVVPEPLQPEALARSVRNALAAAPEQPATELPASGLVGASRPMQQVADGIRRAAPVMATVLIRGESGTGKELVARAIHAQSPRGSGPFVKVHCAALPDALLESELFGYEKGAFTGATARKPGRVEVAEHGTLFLDEIGDITAALQVKLLRLLQDRDYERLGSTETRRADVRFLAATHRNLENMVKQGQFREDLFYRLNVVPLWLPPLRTRPDDIDMLARHFCSSFGAANGRPGARLGEAALATLREQRWPGNVRQLQNLVERLVVMSDEDLISDEAVKRELVQGDPFPTLSAEKGMTADADKNVARGANPSTTGSPVLPLTEEIRQTEKRALVRALKRAKGNRSLAAKLLGVGRATLYKKMQEYDVD